MHIQCRGANNSHMVRDLSFFVTVNEALKYAGSLGPPLEPRSEPQPWIARPFLLSESGH